MDGLASLAAAAAVLFDEPSSSKQQNNSVEEETIAAVLSPSKRVTTSPSKKRKRQREEVRDDVSTSSSVPEARCLSFRENDSNSDRQTPIIQSLLKCLSPLVRMRCQYEWFYSTLDRDYFKQNEFVGCLNQMGLHETSNLTKEEWTAVKSYMSASIGRPRRFSASFVAGELDKLDAYRNQVRKIQYSTDPPPSEQEFPYQIYFPVRVGDSVTVAHAPTSSLQRGSVLSLDSAREEGTEFRVQFVRADLGHLLVDDTDIAIHGEADVLFSHERPGEVSVLKEQEKGPCPRVGQQSAEEEELFKSTWQSCVKEATEMHEEVCMTGAANMSVALSEAEAESSERGSPKHVEVKNEQTDESRIDMEGEVNEVSKVCMACLLFLRCMSKHSTKSEKEAAVFSANTAAFLLQKIKTECATENAELQHKLSMLFVLCQTTCTKNRALAGGVI